ncbi:hypothetical protein OFM39_33970, partial [Escherichia coli]|nr:hypothetical protein [Escherichia coli]
MNDTYLIQIEDGNKLITRGLWNSNTKIWEIKPEYNDISVLNTERQIYALQKEEKGLYTLYDNKNKKSIGSTAYKSINS